MSTPPLPKVDPQMLAEDEAINAAHPIKTGDHKTYERAMRLVGERDSKSDLVDLVNWLLVENNRLRGSIIFTQQVTNKASSEKADK